MTASAALTALEFINYTSQHIYLTGKAGTGKTTFLRSLAEHSAKSFIVIAPTGVAALNAGGVTIHSQFLFPFGAYLPEGSAFQHPDLKLFDRSSLSRQHPLNAARRKVLQGIDLLVIDEISMVRADLLDAIDQRLRQARRKQQPFGGVQLLMIGDLYQLPPIMADHEWQVLMQFYDSPHFFRARALQKAGFVQVELNKVYRQQDQSFVELLNKIRHNQLTEEDLSLLNNRAGQEFPDEAIHLVTHRRQAEAINSNRLKELSSPSFTFKASIRGDFPERTYPMEEELSLKVGAQVMFIRNDTEEGAYYNGKIAEVIELSKDKIWVSMEDQERFEVSQESWKNARYRINEANQKLEEELLGEFSHFPLRLAWAITVHKSQGLSFDQAVLDLGQAFAPGQAYVALTRLRSFEGLFLQTPLSRSSMIVDEEARVFTESRAEEDLLQQLDTAKKIYRQSYLQDLLNWSSWAYSYQDFWQKNYDKLKLKETGFKPKFEAIEAEIKDLVALAAKFSQQVLYLQQQGKELKIAERLERAQEYFKPKLSKLLVDFQALKLEYTQMGRTKLLTESMGVVISEGFATYLNVSVMLESLAFFTDHSPSPEALKKDRKQQLWEELLAKVPEPKTTSISKKTRKGKVVKGETYLKTYSLVKEGLSIAELAKERNLTEDTIYRHCCRGIEEGEIDPALLMDNTKLEKLRALKLKHPDFGAYKLSLNYPEYAQGEWRLLLAILKRDEA